MALPVTGQHQHRHSRLGVIAWVIWCADGSTVTSEDREPSDVPGHGVQAIAQPDRTRGVGNVGYLVLAGYDWYAWHAEAQEWFGMNGDGSLFDQILHRQPIVGICQGRRIPRDRYEAILAEAKAWAEAQGLPQKSGYRPDERAR